MRRGYTLLVGALVLGGAVLAATEAHARCTKLAFSVNDYGKEGPTKDALSLLDKYIVDWTKSKGIKDYTVGKKDVTCELFLDFVVFDEHTCKATAQVCWPDAKGSEKAEAKAAEKAPAK
jgi:hypothetical protein